MQLVVFLQYKKLFIKSVFLPRGRAHEYEHKQRHRPVGEVGLPPWGPPKLRWPFLPTESSLSWDSGLHLPWLPPRGQPLLGWLLLVLQENPPSKLVWQNPPTSRWQMRKLTSISPTRRCFYVNFLLKPSRQRKFAPKNISIGINITQGSLRCCSPCPKYNIFTHKPSLMSKIFQYVNDNLNFFLLHWDLEIFFSYMCKYVIGECLLRRCPGL